MAVILVTYDLRQPGRNYQPVYNYLEQFIHCKGLESVYLLDTPTDPVRIRDDLVKLVDGNDVVFVTPIAHGWAAYNYSCAAWLNNPTRSW